MDAVQRMRRHAVDFGYLRSNAQVVVNTGPYVEILPVNIAGTLSLFARMHAPSGETSATCATTFIGPGLGRIDRRSE